MGHRIVKVSHRLIRAGVVLANCQTSQKGVACYVPDDEQGQYEGVRRLLDKGYRRPICIHLPKGAVATPLRRRGMLRAFKEFQIPGKDQTHFLLKDRPSEPRLAQVDKEADYLETAQFINKALGKRPRPDCIICANDRVAFVAYQHILSLGLRIPKDIGILGFDNMAGVADLFLPSDCRTKKSAEPRLCTLSVSRIDPSFVRFPAASSAGRRSSPQKSRAVKSGALIAG